MSELTDKVAIVTGGGRGIGRATALALAQAGCDVAVFARSSEELERVVGDIRALGRRGIAVTGDLLEATNITHAYTEVVRQLGHIDILMNNAGVVEPLGPITALDPNRWAAAIELNLVGPFRWIRACVPAMLERGWGRIVNISAGAAAETGMQYGNAYATSKAGLEMLTLNLAAEVTGTGVTVNAVRPGAVDTTMNAHVRHQPPERVGQQIHERFKSTYEQGLLLNPDQPARLIVNLIQEGATGEVVSIYDQRGQQLIGQ
jgi:NAD(P)-dependent dehydrogenase (short-subunit alcohol dehydrogenase family)